MMKPFSRKGHATASHEPRLILHFAPPDSLLVPPPRFEERKVGSASAMGSSAACGRGPG